MAVLEQSQETIQKVIDFVSGGNLEKFEEITGIKKDTMMKYRRGNLKIPVLKWMWLLHRSGVQTMSSRKKMNFTVVTNINDLEKWPKFKGKVIRKVKGVIWVESRKKWVVSFMYDGKRNFVGQFNADEHEKAIAALDEAKSKLIVN